MTEIQQPQPQIIGQQSLLAGEAGPPPDTLDTNWRKRASFKIGAACLGVATLIGGTFALRVMQGDGSDTSAYIPPAESILEPDFRYEEVGNVDISEILPSDRILVGTRDNGNQIAVPSLRPITDPSEFAESALALIAGYVSTGNEEMLDELTTNQNIYNGFVKFRDDFLGKSSNGYLEGSDGEEAWQLAIYDIVSDPATFALSYDEIGNPVIEQTGGTLYVNFWSDDQWQGPETKQIDALQTYNFVINDLSFETNRTGGEQTAITGINWNPQHS